MSLSINFFVEMVWMFCTASSISPSLLRRTELVASSIWESNWTKCFSTAGRPIIMSWEAIWKTRNGSLIIRSSSPLTKMATWSWSFAVGKRDNRRVVEYHGWEHLPVSVKKIGIYGIRIKGIEQGYCKTRMFEQGYLHVPVSNMQDSTISSWSWGRRIRPWR